MGYVLTAAIQTDSRGRMRPRTQHENYYAVRGNVLGEYTCEEQCDSQRKEVRVWRQTLSMKRQVFQPEILDGVVEQTVEVRSPRSGNTGRTYTQEDLHNP